VPLGYLLSRHIQQHARSTTPPADRHKISGCSTGLMNLDDRPCEPLAVMRSPSLLFVVEADSLAG
ncbi:hypothetical protein ACGFWD_44725, partial [Streptomyces sp. NPDC048448]|uniref:hypothetical protein n=1 Tax=Streptomyces sp. NPDC048448 TaxID=3365554 RepID=UPI0037133C7D